MAHQHGLKCIDRNGGLTCSHLGVLPDLNAHSNKPMKKRKTAKKQPSASRQKKKTARQFDTRTCGQCGNPCGVEEPMQRSCGHKLKPGEGDTGWCPHCSFLRPPR